MRIALALIFTLLASQAGAQDFGGVEALDSLGEGSIRLFLLITLLSFLPVLAIAFTCFPFMITVLSIMKQAIGLQTAPPAMMLISLALFLTYFVMEPVFQIAWVDGIAPLMNQDIGLEEGVTATLDPFRRFMYDRVEPQTLMTFLDMAELPREAGTVEAVPLTTLVPSFMVSEIDRAFQIGFLIFLPFLIIDLIVAAVLMSMGMMMVPPAIVSLPFKLSFFVFADGFKLITSALVSSYS